jgi:hypothetical protein
VCIRQTTRAVPTWPQCATYPVKDLILCKFYLNFLVINENNILTFIQQDATLHSLFYLETALHVSSGTTTHHQERKQLHLQHLVFVTPLLLSAAIVEELELI